MHYTGESFYEYCSRHFACVIRYSICRVQISETFRSYSSQACTMSVHSNALEPSLAPPCPGSKSAGWSQGRGWAEMAKLRQGARGGEGGREGDSA